MPVALSGIDYGKKWEVFVSPSAFGGFTAYVQFGTTMKAISEPMPDYEHAKQAAIDLLSEIFDVVEAGDAS